ncbi:MAG: lipopolysaccharide kinase InaA family protein [Planctomycetes bacterium]|nr:lipopolysaccharide kinase InaA family protein [Planctomycetota bacterium]
MILSGIFWKIRPRSGDPGAGDFNALMHWEGGTLLATALTRRTWRIKAGEERLYLKIQRIPRPALRYFFRPSAYLREAGAFEKMQRLGLRTPEVVAAGERRRLGFMIESLLLTREVPGSIDLKTWSEEGFGARTGLPGHEEILKELRETVARVHRLGYCFNDLKWRNILAAPPDQTGSRIVIIDQRRFRICMGRWIGLDARARDRALLDKEERRWRTL